MVLISDGTERRLCNESHVYRMAALMVVFLISAVTATAQDVGRAASGHH